MDILLINAPVKVQSEHANLSPPLGLAYIAGVLIQSGYQVSIIDFNFRGLDLSRLENEILKYQPKIIGVSAHTETYLSGLKIAEAAKKINPELKIIMGGPHPTIMFASVAKEACVDIVAIGEGEYTMADLADYFLKGKGQLNQIKGIAYFKDGEVIATAERPFIKNPDELPFPARHLLALPFYSQPGTVLVSRGGCPYNCHFCAVNNIWKGKRRYRQPERVLEEVILILNSGVSREIAFCDDTFSLKRQYTLDFCKLIIDSSDFFRFNWICSTRVDLVDNELLRGMKEAGCINIQYGIEAGSQKILDSIGKNITLEQIKKAVHQTIKNGIGVTCSFMFPHPEDTKETIKEQGRLMKSLIELGAEVSMSLTTPFPGTYYYDNAEALGIKLLARDWNDYDAKHLMISTRNFSINELQELLENLINYAGLHYKKEAGGYNLRNKPAF